MTEEKISGKKMLGWLNTWKDFYDSWMDNVQQSILAAEKQYDTTLFEKSMKTALSGMGLAGEFVDYFIDRSQRNLIFLDIMRKRGSIFLRYLQEGQPPVLSFDFETVINGRTLEKPVNYDLVRIIPREEYPVDPTKRPVVIIDPRAGQGPGIGGSKEESEIGMAMRSGHPVYFILFAPNPVPGQTIADIKDAEIEFIEKVAQLHPKLAKPSVIGNCQAGWAVAMVSAHMPGGTGPIVFNGAPLSYWSGIEGKDTMRYKGGLIGGSWMADMLSDMGNGFFDGANLVLNFELLNPANTFWTKQYNLYSQIDTDEDRYLEFEKWWNGYCLMTGEEISFIVENLFVGNKLEKGTLSMDGKIISLKNLVDPIVVFASSADKITPPGQALNWIVKVWGSETEIKRRRQAIAYMMHKDIGHLGIFVSAKIAVKEHKEIIASFDFLEYLPPGLYEMVIDEEGDEFNVRFEERTFDDIRKLEGGNPSEDKEETEFRIVSTISERNKAFYRKHISPIIKANINKHSAEFIRGIHPLRITRYLMSDMNLQFVPIKMWGPTVRRHRWSISKDNFFVHLEEFFSEAIITALNDYRDKNNMKSERKFKAIYGNPYIQSLFPPDAEKETAGESKEREDDLILRNRLEDAYWMGKVEEGGFPEGIIRILLAIIAADHSLDRREFLKIQQLAKTHPRLQDMTIPKFKTMVKMQSRILQIDPDKALRSLPILLPTPKDREDAFKIAEHVFAENPFKENTRVVIKKIKQIAREVSKEI